MIKDVHFKNPTLVICAELFANTKLRRRLLYRSLFWLADPRVSWLNDFPYP
jgi:hypothetical protein